MRTPPHGVSRAGRPGALGPQCVTGHWPTRPKGKRTMSTTSVHRHVADESSRTCANAGPLLAPSRHGDDGAEVTLPSAGLCAWARLRLASAELRSTNVPHSRRRRASQPLRSCSRVGRAYAVLLTHGWPDSFPRFPRPPNADGSRAARRHAAYAFAHRALDPGFDSLLVALEYPRSRIVASMTTLGCDRSHGRRRRGPGARWRWLAIPERLTGFTCPRRYPTVRDASSGRAGLARLLGLVVIEARKRRAAHDQATLARVHDRRPGCRLDLTSSTRSGCARVRMHRRSRRALPNRTCNVTERRRPRCDVQISFGPVRRQPPAAGRSTVPAGSPVHPPQGSSVPLDGRSGSHLHRSPISPKADTSCLEAPNCHRRAAGVLGELRTA